MVNGLLLLAKAESGDGIPREPVLLDGVVREAVRLGLPLAEAKHLTLEYLCESGGAEARVLGDPGLLRQLVSNLIENAVKFTESGAVVVALSATPEWTC